MNKRTKIAAVAALVLAGGIGAAGAAQAALKDGPPPLPEWVNLDGSINQSKMPTTAEVLDANGKLVRDSLGRPVKVTLKQGPPPVPRNLKADDGIGLKNGNQITIETEIVAPQRPF